MTATCQTQGPLTTLHGVRDLSFLWTDGPVSVQIGEVRRRLSEMESESVQCVVTSPPYWGLRDYGVAPVVWHRVPVCNHEWSDVEKTSETNYSDKRRWQHTRNGRDEEAPPEKRVGWKREEIRHGATCALCGAWAGSLGLEPTPELYVEHVVQVFREVKRVLRKDGSLWLNLGDSYAAAASGRSHPNDEGRPEMDGNFRVPSLASREERWKPKQHAGRAPVGLKPKDLIGIPWRVAFALRAEGWYLRSDIIWSKPNPMPESVQDRPTKAHEYLFLLTRSERYYYDAAAIREPEKGGPPFGEERRAVAVVPGLPAQRAAGKNHRNTGPDGHRRLVDHVKAARAAGADHDNPLGPDGRNKRSVWEVATQPYPEAHFATFPEALIVPCIKAGSREGDVVLDPFAGSGTTLAVARRLGRRAIGIELQPDYLPLIQRRVLESALPLVEVMDGLPEQSFSTLNEV